MHGETFNAPQVSVQVSFISFIKAIYSVVVFILCWLVVESGNTVKLNILTECLALYVQSLQMTQA